VLALAYRPQSWHWSDGALEIVAGTFKRDGKDKTRIWGRPGAQTHGWIIYYASTKKRDDEGIRVHERVHVTQGMIGGPFYVVAYVGHWLWLLVFPPAARTPDEPRWHRAYRGIWAEKMAYRIQAEHAASHGPKS
jgi:hypothetical protein